MGLKKTKLVSIVNVTGIATVGIYTAGLTATAAAKRARSIWLTAIKREDTVPAEVQS